EVLDLILASRWSQTRRQRWTVTVSLVIAITGVGLALAAFASQRNAEANAALAKEQRDRALTTQSRFLADLADQRFAAGDPVTSARWAMGGLRDLTSGIVRR